MFQYPAGRARLHDLSVTTDLHLDYFVLHIQSYSRQRTATVSIRLLRCTTEVPRQNPGNI